MQRTRPATAPRATRWRIEMLERVRSARRTPSCHIRLSHNMYYGK
jgi:hypothetical protein